MILATTTAKTNVTESCELFNYDKIIVYKRELFLNAVKNLRVVSDNHLKLILIQLSGQRKSYITQPLSFDFESDFYEEHSEKEKSGILHLMSYPYEQLKYESYNGFERK